jgi:vancomycin resistance protein YoaR
MQLTASSAWLRVAATAGLVVLVTLTFAWSALGLGLVRMPGVRVGGQALPLSAAGTTALRRISQRWGQASLIVHVGAREFQPVRAELGYSLRVEDAEQKLRELGRSPNPLVSLRELTIGWSAGHELPWRPRTRHPEVLDSFLEHVRTEVERLPLPGSYAPDGSEIAGLAGEAFDTVSARRAVETALARGDSEVTLPTLVTPPLAEHRRFTDPLRATTVLMTSQETVYRPGTGRARNIELAARALDGAIMQPGAALSFNALVGKRELARGFAPALELVNGELAQGVGGGVCQVAGTLHAAAFFAGLTVDEYHAHSRLNRLAYLQPGLDAMVAWPDEARELRDTKDMRIRNPYPFPVRVQVLLLPAASQKLLRVSLFGTAPAFRVRFSFDELQHTAAGELLRADPALPRGQSRVQQTGLDGLVIARRRTIFTPLGAISETVRVAYPPTPRITLLGTQ